MSKRSGLLLLFVLASGAYAETTSTMRYVGATNTAPTTTTSSLTADTTLDHVYDMGGLTLIDNSLQVTGIARFNKYLELVGISTPSTPATGHSFVYLSSDTRRVCAEFDDGSTSCFASATAAPGTITSVSAGLGLTGGGLSGAVTVNLSTPIAPGHLNIGSYQIPFSSATTSTLGGDDGFIYNPSSHQVVLGQRGTNSTSSDFGQIYFNIAGDINITSGPAAAGPPYGLTRAGIALRDARTERFANINGSTYTYVIRSPSYLFETIDNSLGINFALGIAHDNKVFTGNPVASSFPGNPRLFYSPVNQFESIGNLSVGANVAGISTASANGAIIEGHVMIGTATANGSYNLVITSTGTSTVGLYDTTVTGCGRLDIGPVTGLTGGLLNLAHCNSGVVGTTFGTSYANNNFIHTPGGNGALVIGTDDATSLVLGTAVTKRFEILGAGAIVVPSSVTVTSADGLGVTFGVTAGSLTVTGASVTINGVGYKFPAGTNTGATAKYFQVDASSNVSLAAVAAATNHLVSTPVCATVATSSASTVNNFAKSNLAVTITPASNTNRILIRATGGIDCAAAAGNDCYLTILRTNTNVAAGANGYMSFEPISGTISLRTGWAINAYDDPATTSATTYTVAMKITSGTLTLQPNSTTGTLCVEEVQ